MGVSHVVEYGRVRGKSEELRLGPEGNWRWCPDGLGPGRGGAEHWSADPHLLHLSHPLLPRRRTQAFVRLGVRAQGQLLPGGCPWPFHSPGGLGLFWKNYLAPASCPWTAPWGGPSMLLGCMRLSPGHPTPAPGGAVGHHLCQLGTKGHCPAVNLTSLPSRSTRLLRDPLRTQTQIPKPTPACSPRSRQRAPVSSERVAYLLCPLPRPTGLRVSLVGVEPSAPPGSTSPAPSRPVLALTSCPRPPLIPLRPALAGLPAASPTRPAQGCPSSPP